MKYRLSDKQYEDIEMDTPDEHGAILWVIRR